jgi:hypothetical protein
MFKKKGKSLPTGPTRDPMDVGLNRHNRKSQEQPPGWVEEYGAFIAVVGVGLLVLGGGALISPFLPGPPPPAKAQMVVTYGPAKVWGEGTGSQLKSVSVKAQNVSATEAKGIKVSFEASVGRFPLEGPVAVPPGQEAEFKGPINVRLSAEDQGRVVVECENCVPAAP